MAHPLPSYGKLRPMSSSTRYAVVKNSPGQETSIPVHGSSSYRTETGLSGATHFGYRLTPGPEVLRFYGLPMADIHFMTKPLNKEDFLQRVRSLIEKPVTLRLAS